MEERKTETMTAARASPGVMRAPTPRRRKNLLEGRNAADRGPCGRPRHRQGLSRRGQYRPRARAPRRHGEAGRGRRRRDRPAQADQLSATGAHQGVIAVVAAHDYSSVDDIFARAPRKGEPPLIVLCDELSDPHNLGAIIRTAECAGAHGVIIPKRRSVGLYRRRRQGVRRCALEYMPSPAFRIWSIRSKS